MTTNPTTARQAALGDIAAAQARLAAIDNAISTRRGRPVRRVGIDDPRLPALIARSIPNHGPTYDIERNGIHIATVVFAPDVDQATADAIVGQLQHPPWVRIGRAQPLLAGADARLADTTPAETAANAIDAITATYLEPDDTDAVHSPSTTTTA